MLSHIIPAPPPSALPTPPGRQCGQLEGLGGLTLSESLWTALLVLLLPKGKIKTSFERQAFCVLVFFAGGCPSFCPSPRGLPASPHSQRFPGCPAGGTHPLNRGHGSAIEILRGEEGSQQVPGAGSLITHQPLHLDFSQP